MLKSKLVTMYLPKDQKIMKQQRNYLILVAKWNVIQFQVLNKGEAVEYDIYTPQLPKMPSCNIDKQVSKLLTMASNMLVGMKCQQPFMGGYAHAVR
ncbi:MAG: hypothetical protein EZS28_022229 [Streblomastix strix]|uniref:Uncharacterized protein n=1 Tax=Streblomastix strix TaxID=222440 RepID=A0A5J4VI48_9EUKA|nr:MAG: hypothetical protein EZS28_022229 [Streblomastix strix]